jgi:hypothetical protein
MVLEELVVGALGVCALAAIAFTRAPDPMVPINEITPGVVASTDAAEVCGLVEGMTYSERHRAPWHDKYHSMRLYGLDVRQSRDYELDHRLPLSLGGADATGNLWPEPWAGQMNAHDKDRLETWAYRAVCLARTMPLRDAQAMFLGDWRQGYDRVFQGGPGK